MLLMMRAVIAQGEIDSTSERTQVAMDHLKAQRIPCGGLPYGKAYSGNLMNTGGASSSRCRSRWRRFGIREPSAGGKASRPSQISSPPRATDRQGKAWNRTVVRGQSPNAEG